VIFVGYGVRMSQVGSVFSGVVLRQRLWRE